MHGKSSTQQVQRESARYMNSMTRKRQNNYQLFVCHIISVDDHTKRVLVYKESNYTSSGIPCGLTCHKLIQKSEVNTIATASHICRLLTQLDIFMVKDAKNNITEFNKRVNEEMNALSTRRETSKDIIINLFRGYMACSYKKLVGYMKKYEGENVTYQNLMFKVERKCKACIMCNGWNAPMQEQEEIIALKAKIAAWNHPKQKKGHRWNKSNLDMNKMDSRNDNNRYDSNNRSIQFKNKFTFTEEQAWRNIKPSSGDSKTKVVKGPTWKFCEHHQA
jgi:hypothetical protein